MIITTKVSPADLREAFGKLSSYVEAWNIGGPSPPSRADIDQLLKELNDRKIKAELLSYGDAPSTEIDGVEVVLAVTPSIYSDHIRLFTEELAREASVLREVMLLMDRVRNPPPSLLYINGSTAMLVIGRSADMHFLPNEAMPEKPKEPKPLPQPTGLDPADRARIRKLIEDALSHVEPASVRRVVMVDSD